MPATFYVSPDPRVLEQHCLHEFCRDSRALRIPSVLIVPSVLLASHYRGQLAALPGPAAFNVRIMTLGQAVRRLVVDQFGQVAPRWSPAIELVLSRAVHRCNDGGLSDRLAELADGHLLLAGTVRDLADGGIGLRQLEEFRERIRASPAAGSLALLTLDVYEKFVTGLADSGIDWDPLQRLALADRLQFESVDPATALAGPDADGVRIAVAGMYDFTDVNAQVLAGLARHVDDLRFYMPDTDPDQPAGAAFQFGRWSRQDIEARIGSQARTVFLSGAADQPVRWWLDHFPDGDPGDTAPENWTWDRAAGPAAEALAAAARVRQWLDSGLDPVDILVTGPRIDRYLPDLQAAFAEFRIPIRLAGFRQEQPPSRLPEHILGQLLLEAAPAEWVLQYVTLFGNRVQALAGLDRWELAWLIRSRGVWGGRAWSELLQTLDETTGASPALVAFVQLLVDCFVDLPAGPLAADQAAARIAAIAQLAPDPAALSDLAERLRDSGGGPGFGRQELSRLLQSVRQAETYRDPVNRRAVLVAPLMQARGITARRQVILGLDADRMPSRLDPDPFLNDTLRLQLRDLGHRVSVRGAVAEELALVFTLANCSTDISHWVVPTVGHEGQQVAPSPWVQRFTHAWSGGQSIPEPVPRSPRGQAAWLKATGTLLPPAIAARLDGDATGAWVPDMAQSRPQLETLLAGRYSVDQMDPTYWGQVPSAMAGRDVSVTGAATLAACPYRYIAARTLDVVPLASPVVALGADPMAQGNIVHGVLEDLVKEWQARFPERPLSEGGEFLLSYLNASWGQILERFVQPLASLPVPLRDRALADARRRIEQWIATIPDHVPARAVVQQTEETYSLNLAGLVFKGQIDRLDRVDSTAVVTDYKTGRVSAGKQAFVNAWQGLEMQSLLYPRLALTAMPDADSGEFRFVHVGADGSTATTIPPSRPRSVMCDWPADHEVDHLCASLASVVDAGQFPPVADELWDELGADVSGCQYCELPTVCRRYDPAYLPAAGSALARWLPRRAADINRAIAILAGEDPDATD